MQPIKPPLVTLQTYQVLIWVEHKSDGPIERVQTNAFSEDEAREQALTYFHDRHKRADGLRAKITRVEVLSGEHIDPRKRQQSLFADLADVCIGHSMDDVQCAAVNLVLTGVQRRAGNLAEAERRWDELMGRGKQALRRRFRGETDNRDETEVARRLVS